MVFPSPGCITCKKRRIKCDFSRPKCNRCQKANRNCTWQSDQSESWPFKNENAFAEGKQRRPRANNSNPPSQEVVVNQPFPLGIPLYLPLEEYALNYWVANFTSWPNGLQEIESEFGASALRLWDHCHPRSALRLSVSAFALAKFGQAMRSAQAIQGAEVVYVRSIKRMQVEIACLSSETIDQLLVSTLLMGVYDNITIPNRGGAGIFTPPSIDRSEVGCDARLLPGISHCQGTAGLLQIRRQQAWGSDSNLDRVARRPIVRSFLHRGVPVPDWLQEEAEDLGSHDPVAVLDDLYTRLTILRSKCVQLLHQCDIPVISQLHSLVVEVEELDIAFEFWEYILPDEWRFCLSSPQDVQSPRPHLLYECSAHIYLTLDYATVWNRYRAGRLIVLSTYLRLITSVKTSPPVQDLNLQIQKCKSNIESLATDLCCSIEFFYNKAAVTSIERGWPRANNDLNSELSPMAATLLAWPLTIAISMEFVPEKQKSWLRKKLEDISTTLGTDLLKFTAKHCFVI